MVGRLPQQQVNYGCTTPALVAVKAGVVALWLNAVGASAGDLINRHVVRQLTGPATAGHADTGAQPVELIAAGINTAMCKRHLF